MAARAVDRYLPGSVLVEDVQAVDFEMVKQWPQNYRQVSFVGLS